MWRPRRPVRCRRQAGKGRGFGRENDATAVLRITLCDGGRADARQGDLLAGEEPLGIRVYGTALCLTMRTPGDDIELAAVTLAAGVSVPAGARRSFLTTSACGVCGKASIRDLCVLPQAAVAADSARVEPEVLAVLPDRLRGAQRVFSRNGGLHAAGLFTVDGELIAVREDVGRHNAVDKAVGWALLAGRLPLAGSILLVSGRASFELAQKAVLAGIPVLAAVSAPSSLAVELAEEAGLTLVGFLRGASMNVYTGAQRIGMSSATAGHRGQGRAHPVAGR